MNLQQHLGLRSFDLLIISSDLLLKSEVCAPADGEHHPWDRYGLLACGARQNLKNFVLVRPLKWLLDPL